ncbi:MAG: TonB-dependent receptor [Ignavibacteriaceae bacterium]|nr:TonB-dependent receptor [Ignavibacteriaceae bacterium]
MSSLKHLSIMLLITFICIAGFQKTSAQQTDSKITSGKVTGRVFDKLTNKPLQFASFIIISVKDSTKIYGADTDSLGKFTINNIPLGRYRAKLSLIGYRTRTKKSIFLNEQMHEIKLDTIQLIPAMITKDEVQIIAQKERIVYDKENKNKITINPDKDWGVNALELLENTPMINVDFDEKNITMMGQSNPLIYVNGMPGSYSGIESVEDLKFLSTDEIDKFELILNASSEYGIPAQGGVLNIVVKKNHTTSFTGNSSLSGNSDNRYNGNLNGWYNTPTSSVRLNYVNNYSDHSTDNSLSRQITFGNSINILNQSGHSDNKNLSNKYSLGLSFGKPDGITMNNYSAFNEGYNATDKDLNTFYSGNNYDNYSLSKNLLKFFNSNFTFGIPVYGVRDKLVANFMVSKNLMNNENNYNQRKLLSYQSLLDTTITNNDRSDNTNDNYNWNFKYGTSYGQYGNVSVGYNGSYKKMIMHSDYYQYDPINNINFELDKKQIRQQYYENSHAFNFSGTGLLLDIFFMASAKVNMENSRIDNQVGDYSFKNQHLSFDPVLQLMKGLSGDNLIGFSYFGTTQFPSNIQLNPYTNYSDSTNLISGNPDLKPSTSKLFQLDFMHNDSTINFRMSGRYSYTKDLINSVITPVSQFITMTTYANVANQDNLNLELYLAKKFFNCLDLSPTISYNKSKYTGIGVQNEGKYWTSLLNSQFSISNLRFQMNFNYSSSSVTAQEKTKPVWYVDAAAKILLLHKKLSVTLRASDIFNTKNSNSNTYGNGIFITNNIKQTTRVISLSLSYYFRLEAQEIIEPEIRPDVLPDEF